MAITGGPFIPTHGRTNKPMPFSSSHRHPPHHHPSSSFLPSSKTHPFPSSPFPSSSRRSSPPSSDIAPSSPPSFPVSSQASPASLSRASAVGPAPYALRRPGPPRGAADRLARLFWLCLL